MSHIIPAAWRVGSSATKVGALATRPMTSGERIASLVFATAEGAFAYSLFSGPPLWAVRHPIWGYIVGAFAVANLGTAIAGTTASVEGA